MRDGDGLIGWGLATGVWGSWQLPADAKALTADGKLTVGSATADIGTGTYRPPDSGFLSLTSHLSRR